MNLEQALERIALLEYRVSINQDLAEKFRDALKFYAYEQNYTAPVGQGENWTHIDEDKGKIAREALAKSFMEENRGLMEDLAKLEEKEQK